MTGEEFTPLLPRLPGDLGDLLAGQFATLHDPLHVFLLLESREELSREEEGMNNLQGCIFNRKIIDRVGAPLSCAENSGSIS